MAILIGIWEAVLVLAVVVALTALILWQIWRRRLANLRQAFVVQRQIETRDIIKDFVHQASHCLRPIKDSLHLLVKSAQGQVWGGTLADSLGMIEHYEWRLTRLIENMELVCSLEIPDHSFRFSEVKLDAIVSDVVKEFENSARRNGKTVVWSATPEDFPFIPANAEGLRQVFINLIDNAIKYSGEGGEVSVSLEADDSKKVVFARVSDTGPGIPQEDWERIFVRGYRVEDARDRKPKEVGQGLGLYIAKLIVEKHKGRISVAGGLGRGATFTITLPIQRM
jgi:signal transduction histidine kinase